MSQGGEAAITAAARQGHVDMVRLLLDRGADVEARDRVSPLAADADAPRMARLRNRDRARAAVGSSWPEVT